MNPQLAQPEWMQPTRDAMPDLDGAFRCGVAGRALIAVTGNDAAAFLHAQLSTDIHAMGASDARLSSYSDARGRLLAIVQVFRSDSGFLIELPADRSEAVRTQLQRYVLRADVRLEEVSADQAAFGVTGDPARERLAALIDGTPPVSGQCHCTANGARLVPQRGPRQRWLILGPPAAIRPFWDACADIAAAPPGWWELLEIEAGMPTIHTATAGRFVAQMVNLDRLDGIDFRKGCFPGQEVIARTRYLGRVKRRMYPLRVPAAVPAPGDPIVAAGGDGSPCGEVVRAAEHPGGGALALAVLRVEAVDAELALADGTPVTRLAPPYPLGEAA